MSERRKLDIDAPLGDGLPEISPADARQVVHNVISAFVDAAPYGLSDSKYAPKNWNKENENYRSKRKVENVPARRDTMLDTRYKASDLDDTTAFVAAMERMFSRPTGVSTAGEYGAGLAGDTKSEYGNLSRHSVGPLRFDYIHHHRHRHRHRSYKYIRR